VGEINLDKSEITRALNLSTYVEISDCRSFFGDTTLLSGADSPLAFVNYFN